MYVTYRYQRGDHSHILSPHVHAPSSKSSLYGTDRTDWTGYQDKSICSIKPSLVEKPTHSFTNYSLTHKLLTDWQDPSIESIHPSNATTASQTIHVPLHQTLDLTHHLPTHEHPSPQSQPQILLYNSRSRHVNPYHQTLRIRSHRSFTQSTIHTKRCHYFITRIGRYLGRLGGCSRTSCLQVAVCEIHSTHSTHAAGNDEWGVSHAVVV